MARVKRAVHGRKHHRAILDAAKGYYGNKSRSYKAANEQVMHSLRYAYRDRRARKGDFRQLWIQRINAGTRQHGLSYSRFVAGLREAGVEVDRKILADLAVNDAAAFAALVEVAKTALKDLPAGGPAGAPAPPASEADAPPAEAVAESPSEPAAEPVAAAPSEPAEAAPAQDAPVEPAAEPGAEAGTDAAPGAPEAPPADATAGATDGDR